MNRGYAFGFLLVILVLVLGLYVATTGFVASRDTVRMHSTTPVETALSEDLASIELPTFIVTATGALSATLQPEIGATQTVTGAVEGDGGDGGTSGDQVVVDSPLTPATQEPAPPSPPPDEISPAEPLPEATLGIPAETQQPAGAPPTPAPQPAYPFRLAGPPAADPDYPICCYIVGTVRDAAGNGLEGVQVQALSEWTTLPPATTKGGADLGKYDIPINTEVVNWELVLVDGAGNQISPKVQVRFEAAAGKGYRVDWQRTF